MGILEEAEMVVVNRMLKIERDDLARMVQWFERDGMANVRAMEMAQDVLRVSRECGVGLYIEDEAAQEEMSEKSGDDIIWGVSM